MDRSALRTPSQDGEWLCLPSVAEVPALLERHPRTRRAEKLVIMAGHQPELFHPGVWAKNFALAGLAQATGASPVNLVIDNDTLKNTHLIVPIPSEYPEQVRCVQVPFDDFDSETPYEERGIHSPQLFDTFAERVREHTESWPYRPLLAELWPHVRSDRGPIGARLARARSKVEVNWGCDNSEWWLSEVCTKEPFANFVAEILRDLPRFREVYNQAIRDYRRRWKLRSRNHPAPELTAEGDWLESPFWAWRAGASRRERLFISSNPKGFRLRAGQADWPTLPAEQPALVRGLLQLNREGWKVRPRALTTTLFARRELCQLFIHGIGGGKYDEVTDELFRRYWGEEPPPYLVVTATAWLPLPGFSARIEKRDKQARHLRDLEWKPQLFLDDELAAQRAAWVAQQPTDSVGRRRRFREILAITEAMRPRLADLREQAIRELARLDSELHANAILRRRDYSFVLFPEEFLRTRMRAIFEQAAQ